MADNWTISKITRAPPETIATSRAYGRRWTSSSAALSIPPPTSTVRAKPGRKKSGKGLLCLSADRADVDIPSSEPFGRAMRLAPPPTAASPMKVSSAMRIFSLAPRRAPLSGVRSPRAVAFIVGLLSSLSLKVDPPTQPREIEQHVRNGRPANRSRAPGHPTIEEAYDRPTADKGERPSGVGTGDDGLGSDVPDGEADRGVQIAQDEAVGEDGGVQPSPQHLLEGAIDQGKTSRGQDNPWRRRAALARESVAVAQQRREEQAGKA